MAFSFRKFPLYDVKFTYDGTWGNFKYIVPFHGTSSGVASPRIWGGKMFDFRRITLFCLEKPLSKHRMTIFSRNLGGYGPFGPPGYAYGAKSRLVDFPWEPYSNGQTWLFHSVKEMTHRILSKGIMNNLWKKISGVQTLKKRFVTHVFIVFWRLTQKNFQE